MTNINDSWTFDTLQVHAGQVPDPQFGARALPIYQTTSYVFQDADQAAGRFALTDPGPIYTRLNNPTSTVVEERIAALEGGAAALLLASGEAAEFYTFLNLAQAGDNIVSSPSLYGGTYQLLKTTLKQLGINVHWVEDPDSIDSWRAAIDENTKALYGETIPNPKGDILDLEPLGKLAHEHDIPLVVDNTIGTPYNVRPLEHGADIVVESATKFLGGHGTALGGVITEKGDFNWANGKFPLLATPDESYNGITFSDLGPGGFVTRIRATLLRDTGATISPFNAFLIAQGLETLSLRMERHLSNTRAVVDFLDKRDEVEFVRYSGLVTSPYYELAQKYAPKGAGSVFTFELKGGREAGIAFVNALTLFSNLANIGDVRSLVIHPASTTHSQLDDDELAASGISAGTIRLSIGIEGIDDILADLTRGLQAAAKVSA
ncbi:O-acetylhomoserine aminocarboxypropyltransferase/cysteine synthase family protein [Ancrocorticia populi]|uniref:O-acetyl-L-homoserine sulfhydrolase n=1 Tax=Ancrocorticia populi TaxID=2175228 RepID=A0A2V1K4H1_9ACTO|nr:aminotransferase class V-fold PLP-dependent enzyme [Ancrocorticia populi]PWF25990.1 O-acetyl-L-homoserine sulfhydrolase [Ancrocorticia populi]